VKFDSKFGLGEVVIHRPPKTKEEHLLEVKSISFDTRGIAYVCRYPDGKIGVFDEEELIGDPDFHRGKGYIEAQP